MTSEVSPTSYEATARYRLDLARVVRFDGLLLRGEITMPGASIERLIAQEGEQIIVSAVKL